MMRFEYRRFCPPSILLEGSKALFEQELVLDARCVRFHVAFDEVMFCPNGIGDDGRTDISSYVDDLSCLILEVYSRDCATLIGIKLV